MPQMKYCLQIGKRRSIVKIYKLLHDAENYRWLEYKGNWFDFFSNMLDSKPIGNFNEKIECKAIRDKKDRVLGDYPCFSVPAISEKAKNILVKYLAGLVEIFPLETGKLGKYYFMNIPNIVDCLDTDKSEIKYLSSGRIMEIKSYTFKYVPNMDSLKIFKLKNYERGEIYVHEGTKKLIEENNLEGFIFKEVGEVAGIIR